MRLLAILTIWPLVLIACQTPGSVVYQFNEVTAESEVGAGRGRTSIVFLVDGLAAETLQTALDAKRLPQISSFFRLSTEPAFRIGRASFPSLTYPNLTSILTGRTVAEHPIIGNSVLIGDVPVNFESVVNWRLLDSLVTDKSVFKKLRDENQTSVSFSYPFPGGATAYLETNIEAGLKYAEKDFASMDLDVLKSLRKLLENDEADKWPRFIFVHLIGVDSLSHEFGPTDARVQAHLETLDGSLREIFALLATKGQSNHETQTVMTADHGFVTTQYKVPINQILDQLSFKVQVLSDNRITSLYLPADLSLVDRRSLAEALLLIPHMTWSILRKADAIELFHISGRRASIELAPARCRYGQWAARFYWQSATDKSDSQVPFFCPEEYDQIASRQDESFILPALLEFFSSPTSPDLIALPDENSDFSGGYMGNHGGLTKQEMYVPLLTRNVHLPSGVVPTSRLMEILHLLKPAHH